MGIGKTDLDATAWLFKRIYESAVRNGDINPAGKSEAEISAELENLYQYWAKAPVEFVSVVDHTSDILKLARDFVKLNKPQMACVFYATWLEHRFNSLIVSQGNRLKLSEDEVRQIIREVSFRGKVTWLLPTIGLRRLFTSHKNIILRISDIRNSFIHYKWKGTNEDNDEQEKQEIEKCLTSIEKIILYLKRYERSQIFGHKKRVIKNVAKNKAKEVVATRTPPNNSMDVRQKQRLS